MAVRNSEDINYTKEAFLNPWNLVFLIVAMLTAFFLSSSGLQQFILLFTAAAELLYLGILPRQERFRRVVRAQRAAEHNKPLSGKEVFKQLSKQNQKRHVHLDNLKKTIEGNYQRLGYASQGMLESHLKKLDGLLESHLRLLQSQERHKRFSLTSSKNEVARDIKELHEEMETASPKVKAIKQRRLNILERRLDKFKRANENLEIIEAQLETIEDVTKYIHEQSITMRNPEEITFQLDTLLSEVEETQASVEEIEEVFSDGVIGGLLDDIDTYESSGVDSEKTGPAKTRVAE